MAKLVLVRHCLSDYNAKGLWTGWDNPPLSNEGRNQAKEAAKTLQDIPFDAGFVPPQKRSNETLSIILSALHKENLPITENRAIMERNYGIYTGKNKWNIQKEVGDEEFLKLRRGWDYPIPEGESLKQVSKRVIPFYVSSILPQLKAGKNVILVSSNNALRSLVKYLNNIPDEKIAEFEIAVGEILVYTVDEKGHVIEQEHRNATNPVP